MKNKDFENDIDFYNLIYSGGMNLFEEKDFFLKDELEKGNYTEHDLISTENIVMPCLSIETDWEYYELYVCICENGN